jgi:hypothetical protein
MNEESKVIDATVRDGLDEWHIECRFDNGEKFAAVTVDYNKPELAQKIARFLSVTDNETQNTSPVCDYVAVRWDALEALLFWEAAYAYQSATGLVYEGEHAISAQKAREILTNPNPDVVVVRTEPTQEILDAGEKTYSEVLKFYQHTPMVNDVTGLSPNPEYMARFARYKVMLAARPKGEV